MPAGSGSAAARPGRRALVVVSRFNEGVTRKLLAGATDALARGGFAADAVDVVWVPGAFELGIAMHRGLDTGWYALAVALGAVIRGETPHFEYLAGAATQALTDAATRFRIPIGYGVLTCETLDQALARAGGAGGNKGREAAEAALATLRALEIFDGRAQT